MLAVVVTALAATSVSGLVSNLNTRARSFQLAQGPPVKSGAGFNYDPSNYKDSNSGRQK
jgi:hypothetical protein